jgi:hypothetical protein
MRKVSGRTFHTERVQIDDTSFVNCTFDRCNLIYSGSERFGFDGCKFNDCRWGFEGAAAFTIGFLTVMYGAQPEMIEATFENIRRGVRRNPIPQPE